MDGRAWNSGYQVTVDGGRTQVWVRSIREVTRLFNEAGVTITHLFSHFAFRISGISHFAFRTFRISRRETGHSAFRGAKPDTPG